MFDYDLIKTYLVLSLIFADKEVKQLLLHRVENNLVHGRIACYLQQISRSAEEETTLQWASFTYRCDDLAGDEPTK